MEKEACGEVVEVILLLIAEISDIRPCCCDLTIDLVVVETAEVVALKDVGGSTDIGAVLIGR